MVTVDAAARQRGRGLSPGAHSWPEAKLGCYGAATQPPTPTPPPPPPPPPSHQHHHHHRRRGGGTWQVERLSKSANENHDRSEV